jgi:hypothetical protein
MKCPLLLEVSLVPQAWLGATPERRLPRCDISYLWFNWWRDHTKEVAYGEPQLQKQHNSLSLIRHWPHAGVLLCAKGFSMSWNSCHRETSMPPMYR